MTYLADAAIGVISEILNGIMAIFIGKDGEFWQELQFDKPTIHGPFAKGLDAKDVIGGPFDDYFPGLTQFSEVFVVLALSLIFILAIVFLLEGLMPDEMGLRPDSPLGILGRLVLATFFTYYAYSIMKVLYTPMNYILKLVADTIDSSKTLNWGMASGIGDDVASTNAWGGENLIVDLLPSNELGGRVVVVLIEFAITFAFAKLILEVVERYVIMGVLFYISPLPMASLISSKTSNIFSSFVRMFFAEGLVMAMSIIFIVVFAHSWQYMNRDVTGITAQGYIVRYAALLAWLRLGSRFDELLNQMGLSTARTGAGMLGDMVAGGMFAVHATRGISKLAKGTANQFRAGKAASDRGASAGQILAGGATGGMVGGTGGVGTRGGLVNTGDKDFNKMFNSGKPTTGAEANSAVSKMFGMNDVNNAQVGKGQATWQDSQGNSYAAAAPNADFKGNTPVIPMEGAAGGNFGVQVTNQNGYINMESPTIQSMANDVSCGKELSQKCDSSSFIRHSTGNYSGVVNGVGYEFANTKFYDAPQGAQTLSVGGEKLWAVPKSTGQKFSLKAGSIPESKSGINKFT